MRPSRSGASKEFWAKSRLRALVVDYWLSGSDRRVALVAHLSLQGSAEEASDPGQTRR